MTQQKIRVRKTPNCAHPYTATCVGNGTYGCGNTPEEARSKLVENMNHFELERRASLTFNTSVHGPGVSQSAMEPLVGRPVEADARAAIEAWLDEHAPGYPTYKMVEDGDNVWAFWVAEQDTTSYLHADLTVEWYGTTWPDLCDYDGDSGVWSTKTPNTKPRGDS